MTPHTPKTYTPTTHHYPQNTHMHTTRHMFTHKHVLVPDHIIHIYTTAMRHTHTHTHVKNTLKTYELKTTKNWKHTLNTGKMKNMKHTSYENWKPQHNWKHRHTSITNENNRTMWEPTTENWNTNWNKLKDDNQHAIHNNKKTSTYKVKLRVDTYRTMNTYHMEPNT